VGAHRHARHQQRVALDRQREFHDALVVDPHRNAPRVEHRRPHVDAHLAHAVIRADAQVQQQHARVGLHAHRVLAREPRSYASFATQRMPLPHICPREPSALYMIMRTSAAGRPP